jgi:polar amino acid transport system substrate-binding protein
LYRIAKNEPFHYRSLSELQGSVAVLRSTNLGQIHKILEDTDLELVHVETVEQGIGMLLAGRVDYAFGDNTTTDTYTEIKNINKLQFSEIPLTEAKVGFYYNIDCEEAIYKTKP